MSLLSVLSFLFTEPFLLQSLLPQIHSGLSWLNLESIKDSKSSKRVYSSLRVFQYNMCAHQDETKRDKNPAKGK